LRAPAPKYLAVAVLLAALAIAGCGSPTSAIAPVQSSHVVLILLENKEQGVVVGSSDAPYLNSLTRLYGLATRSYGVTHPSLPNYLALTSGATHGITEDCTACHIRGRNLADQLEAAGLSWKGYMEGMPRPCFRGAGFHRYAKKHDPFAYYDDIASDDARCRRRTTFTELDADLRAQDLPSFVYIAPDLCHDMHDCSVATGDRFLSRLVPRLLQAIGPHGFIVLTFDEGSTSARCCGGSHGGQIATIVAGPDVEPGARLRSPVDHYGVLRTIEDAFGLAPLGAAADSRHGSLNGLFSNPPRIGR
jgi:phosphatidylinositol-3-phosphatase